MQSILMQLPLNSPIVDVVKVFLQQINTYVFCVQKT